MTEHKAPIVARAHRSVPYEEWVARSLDGLSEEWWRNTVDPARTTLDDTEGHAGDHLQWEQELLALLMTPGWASCMDDPFPAFLSGGQISFERDPDRDVEQLVRALHAAAWRSEELEEPRIYVGLKDDRAWVVGTCGPEAKREVAFEGEAAIGALVCTNVEEMAMLWTVLAARVAGRTPSDGAQRIG